MSIARGKIKISVKASFICQIHADLVVHQRLFKFGQVRRAWRFYSLPFKSCQQFLHQRSRLSVPWRDFFCFKKINQAGPLGHRNVKLAYAQCSQRDPHPPRAVKCTPCRVKRNFFFLPKCVFSLIKKIVLLLGNVCVPFSQSMLTGQLEPTLDPASAFLTRKDMVTGPGPDGHHATWTVFPRLLLR